MHRTSMYSKDLVAASSRPLLLALLAEGDNYGYALIQRVKELSGGTLQWSEGMLYPILHRLEKEGHIVSEWRESDTGRKRKYYCLTKTGGREAKEEQREWLAVHNILARLWSVAPTHV